MILAAKNTDFSSRCTQYSNILFLYVYVYIRIYLYTQTHMQRMYIKKSVSKYIHKYMCTCVYVYMQCMF